MIAVTGASRRLGRLVVEGLLKQRRAEEVVALVRNCCSSRPARSARVSRTTET